MREKKMPSEFYKTMLNKFIVYTQPNKYVNNKFV